MKKTLLTILIIVISITGLIYADRQFEDGLLEEIQLLLTPDPMERNTYDDGECTYYVFDMVKDDGNMIEKSWGDAEDWAERASFDGYAVNDVPEAGSILQTGRGPIGHLAYIESINDDGSLEISEMNLYEQHEVTERTIESEEVQDYQYIHPEENPHAKEYTDEA